MPHHLRHLKAKHWRHAAKTGIAGALAGFVASRIGLPQPYWSAVSAGIIMQSQYETTVKTAILLIVGTAVGALASVPFSMIARGNLICYALACFITVLVCSALKLEGSQRMGATTVAVVMLIPHAGPPWLASLDRFMEVSLGIAVSLAVARVIWPVRTET